MEHRPLTDREIIEACCLNLVETYFALARAANGTTCFEDDGIIGCRSESGHPAANFAMVARPNIHSVTRLANKNLDSIYILPTDQSFSVIEMMTRAGFVAGASLNLMFLRNPSGGINLDLQTIQGISRRFEQTFFLASQFFATANPGFCEGIASMTSNASQCELIALPGKVSPIGGAMLFQTPGILGLYNIAIAAESRSRGLGSELVRSLAGVAASRGCAATLQCHNALVPWYERLGFRKYAEVVMMRK